MRSPLLLALGIAVFILALLPVFAQETHLEQQYPDGTLKARYTLNAAGEKHGQYAEFFQSGKPKIKCAYRNGELHGSYSSYHENGRRHIVATYRNGMLHGKYSEKAPDRTQIVSAKYDRGQLNGVRTFYRGKTVLSVQKWKQGRLLALDGIEPFPRSREEIRLVRAEIVNAGWTPDDPEAADRQAGLRVLKQYRYVVGVPWRGLTLDDDLNAKARAGASLCQRYGQLSHKPPNPGLPEDEFRLGRIGTENCNLGRRESSPKSVHGFMDDSDPTNIDRVGHRCWCVNPPMGKTGFGVVGSFNAMWAMDESGQAACEYDVLTYPARGYMPVDLFGARHAFSVWALPGDKRGSRLADTMAAVYRLDENYVRAAESLELDYHHYSTERFGAGPCLIFRPKVIDISAGSRYAVVLTGFDEKKPYWFLVEFFQE